jgi:ABC-type dipeptide/oligopeptide/nickel transport system permease component
MPQVLSNPVAVIALPAVLACLVGIAARAGLAFLLKRLSGFVVVMLGVSAITFFLTYANAGLNGARLVGVQCNLHCTPTLIRVLEDFYHLRDPWYQQYAEFLARLVHFDLGYSFVDRERSVWSILRGGVPVSLELQAYALAVELLIGIPLGVLGAARAGSWLDAVGTGGALILYALPPYLLITPYLILTVILAQRGLPHLPLYGWGEPLQAVAPIAILAAGGTAFYARLTRTAMLEALGQDYVRTARAKGLRERVVLLRHTYRNATVPLITALGPALALTVTGAFFVEAGFQIPGIGYATLQSINDPPVLQGFVLLVALAVSAMNFAADVAVGLADPRVRTQ